MSEFQILLSCMHQKDWSIVGKSNICSDVVIVNQCDRDEQQTGVFKTLNGDDAAVTFDCTTERGLSRSRNRAIRISNAEICLIADDDELFETDCKQNILNAFNQNREYDVILFKVDFNNKQYPAKRQKIGYIQALRTYSVQIAFRRKSIVEKGIEFDEEMGSGTGHGCCEEAKFIYDCLKAKCKVLYVPVRIAKIEKTGSSVWFRGHDSKFFFDRGWATRRFMGKFWASLYAVYYALAKHKTYRPDCKMSTALKYMFKGIRTLNYPENPNFE